MNSNAEETLRLLAEKDLRFETPSHRLSRHQEIKFRVFVNTLCELSGMRILIKFIPKKGEFDRINDIVAKICSKIEARISKGTEEACGHDNLFDIWGDGLLFALPHILYNARSSLFQSIRGTVQVSVAISKKPSVVVSGDLLFGQYETIVRTLIGYRAKDPERSKKYRATKTKKMRNKPIFFWMQGKVPSVESMLKLLSNDDTAKH